MRLWLRTIFLYDLTHLERVADGTLGWFYPIYVSRHLDFVRPTAFWEARDNDAVIRAQAERRATILKSNAALLQHIKQTQRPPRETIDFDLGPKVIGRNDVCSCGSGPKYKH